MQNLSLGPLSRVYFRIASERELIVVYERNLRRFLEGSLKGGGILVSNP